MCVDVCSRPRPPPALPVGGCSGETFPFHFWQTCLFGISTYITRRKISVSVGVSHGARLLRPVVPDPEPQEKLHTQVTSLGTSGYVALEATSLVMDLPEEKNQGCKQDYSDLQHLCRSTWFLLFLGALVCF